MKKLTCEVCGGADFQKQDGVFVCQFCGCKYGLEEVRKMMVEGTVDVTGSMVKVDNTDKLNKLLVLAKRAREEDNTEDAKKYYEMAMIEDPTNWESAFYASYYHLMESPIAQLPETLKNFNRRAGSSLELIFSKDFHGNVLETVDDFLTATVKLYLMVTTHEIENRKKGMDEFISSSMQFVLGKISEDTLTSRKDTYRQNMRRSFELLSDIRGSIFKLCDLAEQHKSSINVKNLVGMYDICDTIYMLDAKDVVEMDNYLDFTSAALRYEQMRKEENPDFVSKGVEMLLEKGQAIYKGGKGNPKGKKIIDLIENRRDEVQRARAKLYWDAHLEEFESLNGEIDQINSEKKKLNETYNLTGKKKQEQDMTDDINRIIRERNSLGLFKGKEKKLLQAQIDEITAKREALRALIDSESKELDEKLLVLNKRLEEINLLLTKGR